MAPTQKDLGKQQDVVISIGFQIENIRKKMDKTVNSIKTRSAHLSSALFDTKSLKGNTNKFKKQAKKMVEDLQLPTQDLFTKKTGKISKPKLIKTLGKEIKGTRIEAQKAQIAKRMQLEPLKGKLNTAKLSMARMKNAASQLRVEFQGWALSIMFFGMALQRVFTSVWKSASKTFQDVSSSVEGTVTGFDMLNGSLKYLQFTAGQALEPLAYALIPIIDKISEWVSENEELTRQLAGFSGIFGTLFMVGGMLVLAFMGFFDLIKNKLIPVFMKLAPTAIKAIASIGIPFWSLVAIVGTIIAIIYGLWTSNFGGIQQFVKNTLGFIMKFFGEFFAHVKKILSGIIDVLTGIFTADFERVWEGLVKIATGAFDLLKAGAIAIGATIFNTLLFVFKWFMDWVKNAVLSVLGLIKKVAQFTQKYLGFGGRVAESVRALQSGVVDKFSVVKDLKYLSVDDFYGKNASANVAKNTPPIVNIDVELDGDKVAKSTSTRILDTVNSMR